MPAAGVGGQEISGGVGRVQRGADAPSWDATRVSIDIRCVAWCVAAPLDAPYPTISTWGEIMKVPGFLVAAFPPSMNGLIDGARRKTDDSMLWDIAMADYGQGASDVMPELRAIRDTGIIKPPVSNELFDVLSLTHYINPEVPDPPPFRPGPTGPRGHQTRFFACALLLHIESEWSYGFRMTTDSALANGIASAKFLCEETSEGIGGFLTWRLVSQADEPDSVLLALALLILATRLRSNRFTESDLGAVATWVLTLESIMHKEAAKIFPDHMGLWPPPFSLEAGFWQPVAAEFKQETESIRDDHVRLDLELCGLLLDSQV